jgi:uncharacterized protein YggT (Ycf19 family)
MTFVTPFFNVLLLILSIIEWIVIVWVILSWLLFFAHNTSFRWRNRGAYHVLEQLNDICSRMAWPFIRPIRKLLRRYNTAGIDWSPLILLVLLYFIRLMLQALYGAILPGSVGRG